METDIDELLSSSAFDSLEPERLELIREFAWEIDGKSTGEIISLFMRFLKDLKKGRPITKLEKQAMITAIGASIPADEQGKFRHITGVVEKFI
ncbi:MAG: hypothetical protein LBT59_07595 [Clostridiales bacterium]|jgi:hypothetical protein|nr:hypothetical protein [Clostridiales bacterium]